MIDVHVKHFDTVLEYARFSLIDAQNLLADARRLEKDAPEHLREYSRIMVKRLEVRVGDRLDFLWLTQCRAVFEDHKDGFFRSRACARFVNMIDWAATGKTLQGGCTLVVLRGGEILPTGPGAEYAKAEAMNSVLDSLEVLTDPGQGSR